MNPAASSPDKDIVISRCKSYWKLPIKEIVDYEKLQNEIIFFFLGRQITKSLITYSLL
jgi:hypothetical protein